MRRTVPSPDPSWNDIRSFALTFNSYLVTGSFEASAEIVNQRSALRARSR